MRTIRTKVSGTFKRVQVGDDCTYWADPTGADPNRPGLCDEALTGSLWDIPAACDEIDLHISTEKPQTQQAWAAELIIDAEGVLCVEINEELILSVEIEKEDSPILWRRALSLFPRFSQRLAILFEAYPRYCEKPDRDAIWSAKRELEVKLADNLKLEVWVWCRYTYYVEEGQ